MEESLLLADVGGTKTELSIVDRESLTVWDRQIKHTSNFETLSALVSEYMEDTLAKDIMFPVTGIFAIAGEVKGDIINLTNSPIQVNRKDLENETPLQQVHFLNDLEAAAYNLRDLNENKITTLIEGEKGKGPRLLIAVGTGLGVSCEFEGVGEDLVMPSEAGHTIFQPVTEQDEKLKRHIKEQSGKREIEWEDVLSGRGLETIYQFVVGNNKEFAENPMQLPAQDISRCKDSNEAAMSTFHIFYSLLGRFCRMQFLQTLSYGGVYLSGGVVRKNLDIGLDSFRKEFSVDGKKVPVMALKEGGDTVKGLIRYAREKL